MRTIAAPQSPVALTATHFLPNLLLSALMSLWKRIRYRMEAAAMRLLAWWIPRLSRSQCLRFANALGALGARFDRRGSAVALANLECAFGDRFTGKQREAIVRDSYQNFV